MKTRSELMWSILLSLGLAVGVTACDEETEDVDSGMVDAGGDVEDAGGDMEDAGGDMEDAGGDMEDAGGEDAGAMDDAAVADGAVEDGAVTDGGIVSSVTVADQTLDDLSTVVTVAEAVIDMDGWMVIHEDDGGASGPVIGHALLTAGTNTDVMVVLDRPAVTETLHAMLHYDTGTAGTYEFGTDSFDPPVTVDGSVVVEPFDVTVPDGTPAVRLTVGSNGLTDWVVTMVEPAVFGRDEDRAIVSGPENDPTLTFYTGWRYEVANPVASVHPFQVINRAVVDTPATDTVLLAQGGTGDPGSLESDADIDWDEVGDSVLFTIAPPLPSQADGYRCGAHTAQMRGEVVITDAP